MNSGNDWLNSNIHIFWSEIARCKHVVQVYDDDEILLSTLKGFVGTGLMEEQAVIVIAPEHHHTLLDQLLILHGFDLNALRTKDLYIPISVEAALGEFMNDGWPDEGLFRAFAYRLIQRARTNSRQVRAFGELAQELWRQGLYGATIHLETLWHDLSHNEGINIYCAYPASVFTDNASGSIRALEDIHHLVLAGLKNESTDIFYKVRDHRST